MNFCCMFFLLWLNGTFLFRLFSESEEDAVEYIKNKRPIFPVKYNKQQFEELSGPSAPHVVETIELSDSSSDDSGTNDLNQSNRTEDTNHSATSTEQQSNHPH